MSKRIISLCVTAMLVITGMVVSSVMSFILPVPGESKIVWADDGNPAIHAYYFLTGVLPTGYTWESALDEGIISYNTSRIRGSSYNVPIVDGECNGAYPSENTSLESLSLTITFDPLYVNYFSKVNYDETQVTYTKVGFSHTFTPTYERIEYANYRGQSQGEDLGGYITIINVGFEQGEALITQNVTFCNEDGSELYKFDVAYNTAVERPTNPTLKGYKFDGWYTDTTYTEEFDFDTLITSETNIYAKWVLDKGDFTQKILQVVVPLGAIFLATPLLIYVMPKQKNGKKNKGKNEKSKKLKKIKQSETKVKEEENVSINTTEGSGSGFAETEGDG